MADFSLMQSMMSGLRESGGGGTFTEGMRVESHYKCGGGKSTGTDGGTVLRDGPDSDGEVRIRFDDGVEQYVIASWVVPQRTFTEGMRVESHYKCGGGKSTGTDGGTVLRDGPDSDGEVKIKFDDGVEQYVMASWVVEVEVRSKGAGESDFDMWKEGDYARYNGQVGELTMDPDSDQEVKLRYGDGTRSGYVNISRLSKASASDYNEYESEDEEEPTGFGSDSDDGDERHFFKCIDGCGVAFRNSPNMSDRRDEGVHWKDVFECNAPETHGGDRWARTLNGAWIPLTSDGDTLFESCSEGDFKRFETAEEEDRNMWDGDPGAGFLQYYQPKPNSPDHRHAAMDGQAEYAGEWYDGGNPGGWSYLWLYNDIKYYIQYVESTMDSHNGFGMNLALHVSVQASLNGENVPTKLAEEAYDSYKQGLIRSGDGNMFDAHKKWLTFVRIHVNRCKQANDHYGHGRILKPSTLVEVDGKWYSREDAPSPAPSTTSSSSVD